MIKELRVAIVCTLVMTLLLGVLYPWCVTGFAILAVPHKASGSLVYSGSKPVGSAHIGQAWDGPQWFRGRPSATSPQPYEARASGGSNWGVHNPALVEQIRTRATQIQVENGTRAVPVDLLTASASGLDPDISPQAARLQVPRVARARGISEVELLSIVEAHIERPWLGLLGEPRVNVLLLNLELTRPR